MKNIQLLDFPSFRHSDLKYTNKRLKILSTKFYYKNLSINFFKLIKEFKTRKYSEVFHDEKKFYLFRKKKLFSRSEILESIIKKIIKKKYLKILDFGCNKGNLLFKLKKKKYKYLYGYDINRHFKKNFENSDIQFSSNLNFKKNFFDYIIFSHSISYVPNLEKTLKLIRKISKTNALLIFNLQNVETRPHNLLFSDQRYHFNKKMIQNFFGSYGSINFISENALNHEFVFTLKLEKKNKHNKKKKIDFYEIKYLKENLKKILKIKFKCDIFGYNIITSVMKKILGNKIKYFVLENDSAANKNNKKNIINIKIHKKNKIPLLVNYKYKNLQIIRRLKKKYNVNDIITL